MAGGDFSELVSPHTVHSLVIGRLVVLDGDLGRHAAHGVYAPLVAGLDQQFNLGRMLEPEPVITKQLDMFSIQQELVTKKRRGW